MTTKIEWTDKTWNPITGCSPISEGCKNCYAERMTKRLAGRYGYPKDEPFKVVFHPDRVNKPSRWVKPRKIFAVSMGDLFHDDVQFEWQYKIFEAMAMARHHTFMVLTKRSKNMAKVMPDIWFHLGRNYDGLNFPLPNVIGMVTAENQKRAEERIPDLLKSPFAVRGVSVEPMLGPVDLVPYLLTTGSFEPQWIEERGLDWVICGGESGPGARPMHPDWVVSLRDQCKATSTPFFFKQWGEWIDWIQASACKWSNKTPQTPSYKGRLIGSLSDRNGPMFDGKAFATKCIDQQIYCRVGKKKSGRLLDGKKWSQFPEVDNGL